MPWHNKVIWSEGMFLRPQHFQQQDRCLEHLVALSLLAQRPYAWGVSRLEIDRALLESGQLAVPSCRGIMPDGTLFNVPEDQDPPPPLRLNKDVRDQIVLLAAPIETEAGAAAEIVSAAGQLGRYQAREISVYDIGQDSLGSKAEIAIGRMRLGLRLASEPAPGWLGIPVARIVEVREQDGRIVLDDAFIPSCIDYTASAQLTGFLRQIEGLMRQRAEALAARVSTGGRGGVSETADFLLLQVVNRLQPVVRHLAEAGGAHPEQLYRDLLAIAGELATFTEETKRPEAMPGYRHENLITSFKPVEDAIVRSLTLVMEPTATAISLEELRFGIRRAIIEDRSLLDSAAFILEVSADMDPEQLVRAFRDQSKIGPVEKIRELVNLALPGVPVRARPTAPRQVPYHAGASYFEIDKNHELWRAIDQSGVLTLHVAGTFPNLALTLWAIKR
ncbi:Type VI secretion system-associated protein [Candidatus Defluviicoccus seviourii]|uniref:Type VI secretion system-associated protein n=1 Tax=Candidatus Defluviicoccus seviourii TaxID=2565273 RepID=A0A564WG72_9PROT|nr:Type VI secretion system-associated protein [Candidatus Defluviicoccus seviourii]